MSIRPNQAFRYCPRCGASRGDTECNPLLCAACGFRWYFNPTCAAGAFLFNAAGEVLWVRRANDPNKGTLALPGGFIDAGESAEAALRREVREEIGIEIPDFEFVGSWPNRYDYGGIAYDVCDFLFAAYDVDATGAVPLDGVAGIEWHRLAEIAEAEIAFPSLRHGRTILMERGR
jgi:8-oxo-dGTP pyrophosphatase MutT (NUDIX family)